MNEDTAKKTLTEVMAWLNKEGINEKIGKISKFRPDIMDQSKKVLDKYDALVVQARKGEIEWYDKSDNPKPTPIGQIFAYYGFWTNVIK